MKYFWKQIQWKFQLCDSQSVYLWMPLGNRSSKRELGDANWRINLLYIAQAGIENLVYCQASFWVWQYKHPPLCCAFQISKMSKFYFWLFAVFLLAEYGDAEWKPVWITPEQIHLSFGGKILDCDQIHFSHSAIYCNNLNIYLCQEVRPTLWWHG